MMVRCEKCDRYYDDADRWTICPHNLLEAASDAPRYTCGQPGYCAGHDLFNYPLVPPAQPPAY